MLAVGRIRTAISELLEGSIGTIHPATGRFSRGVFDGQPEEAMLSLLRQTSTAVHWFDVVVDEHGSHESSPMSTRASARRIYELPITIEIYSGLATEAQETDRGTLLAEIASDCEDARQSLGYPGNLTETASALETGIIGGLMRGPGFSGLPDLEMLDENWGRRWAHSRISGAIICIDVSSSAAFGGQLDFSEARNSGHLPGW